MTALRESKPQIKIVLLGDTNTGAKTCLLARYVDGVFAADTTATLGAASRTKAAVVAGVPVTLTLWGLCTHTHTLHRCVFTHDCV